MGPDTALAQGAVARLGIGYGGLVSGPLCQGTSAGGYMQGSTAGCALGEQGVNSGVMLPGALGFPPGARPVIGRPGGAAVAGCLLGYTARSPLPPDRLA